MATMNQDELKTYMKEYMAPMLKDIAGPVVKDIVEEAQAKASPPQWADALFGQRKAEEPHEAPREKGLEFGSIIRATAAAKLAGQPPQYAIEALKKWGYTSTAKTLEDYQSKALAAGDATAGGFLVPIQFSQDVIEVLRPKVVIRALGPTIMPMPTGTVQVPKITNGSTATYIGENANVVKTQQTMGQLTLTFKKLAALVPISNDLIRYSSPSADTVVRNDVVRALASRENSAFLRGSGTGAVPKGLRHWCPPANVIAANSTVNLANVTTDLGKLMLQLENNNIPLSNPAWIMAPRTRTYLMTVQDGNGNFPFRPEMLTGRLWGYPFGSTTDVPINLTDGGGTNESELYFVDMADAVIGESERMMVDSSSEAAYHDGSNVIAAYSQDQTVIRAIEEHDFAMRREESVAVLNQMTWGG